MEMLHQKERLAKESDFLLKQLGVTSDQLEPKPKNLKSKVERLNNLKKDREGKLRALTEELTGLQTRFMVSEEEQMSIINYGYKTGLTSFG